MLKRLLAVTLGGLLAGCTSGLQLADYAHTRLHPQVLHTPSFEIQGMLPADARYPRLRVYIEGDGHAWATRSQPSTDPTPHTSLMLRYASEDSQPAAYLARPCQFVMAAGCSTAVWTDGRFSPAVMSAMNAALQALKQRYQVTGFELVGHSGGGAVALVLAGLRDDVDSVQTIAGNLDPVFWTQLNGLTPLTPLVAPLQYGTRLQHLPQRHWVGTADRVVPSSVARHYAEQLGGHCVQIVALSADHGQGYDQAWRGFAAQAPQCGGGP